MSRISCDVTKDLFTVYLDEICSEESKSLVEEHLQECPKCRQMFERMQEKDNQEPVAREQVHFFEKAKKYIDNRYKLVFFITLLLVMLMAFYSDFYYSYVPDIIVYVAFPLLMCTFFLAQPKEKCTNKKYCLMQGASVLSVVLLIAVQCFVVWQLGILLLSPHDARLLGIFTWEPARLGPFLEMVYRCFVFAETVLIVLYYLLGKREKCSFPIGQNVSWLGMGLGIMFRASLFRMDTYEGYRQGCLQNMGILLAEFAVVLLLNLVYIKQKNRYRNLSGL